MGVIDEKQDLSVEQAEPVITQGTELDNELVGQVDDIVDPGKIEND